MIELEEPIMTSYKRMSLEDRTTIELELKQNTSLSAIGRKLGRSTSSISREIKDHRVENDVYALYLPTNRCIERRHCDRHDLCAGLNYICRKKKCSACRKVIQNTIDNLKKKRKPSSRLPAFAMTCLLYSVPYIHCLPV